VKTRKAPPNVFPNSQIETESNTIRKNLPFHPIGLATLEIERNNNARDHVAGVFIF